MTDVRFPISGNIRAWFIAENGLANPKAPTEAEIAAGLDISDAISWNDKDFGNQASTTSEDPAITAKGKVQSRGAAQYGGGLSFYYPQDRTDSSSIYVLTENALGRPGVRGYLIFRIDGVELTTTTGNANHPGTLAKAGDYVWVYKVETAGFGQAITGEEAFRYTVSFLPKGFVKTYAVVRLSATAVAPVVTGATTATAGSKVVLAATLIGREYTRGLKWTGSSSALGTVRAGIVSAKAAGALTITATDDATGLSDTHVITIS
jgi:hypothetical protein